MATLAQLLGMGGMPQGMQGANLAQFMAMINQGGCFPRENIAKCQKAAQQALRSETLDHVSRDEHLGHLSLHYNHDVDHKKNSLVDDREFLADREQLPKWQLVRNEKGKVQHIKSSEYVAEVEAKVAINASRIETLEALQGLFADACANALAATRTLYQLNNEVSQEGVEEFKEGVLKIYEDSREALEERISEIAQTIPQDTMIQLLPGIMLGQTIQLSAAQQGTKKALADIDHAMDDLKKYEHIVRSCLAGIIATYSEPQDEGLLSSEESSSDNDDFYS